MRDWLARDSHPSSWIVQINDGDRSGSCARAERHRSLDGNSRRPICWRGYSAVERPAGRNGHGTWRINVDEITSCGVGGNGPAKRGRRFRTAPKGNAAVGERGPVRSCDFTFDACISARAEIIDAAVSTANNRRRRHCNQQDTGESKHANKVLA